ncbi:uncharacterized protein [Ptychodera flava]|uniref:uncharacterized protein isoform X2 n=1 Tax=Ptychodera flava TaxID=63121 RepID=UPI00396A2FEB
MADTHEKTDKVSEKREAGSDTVVEDAKVDEHHDQGKLTLPDSEKLPASSDYATAKKRIEGQLEMLRRDLTMMQTQDQSLLRQLLHIHEMIGQLSGQRFRRSSVATALGGGVVEVEIQEIIERLSPRRLRSFSLSTTDHEDLPEFAFDESFDQLSCSYPSAF